MSMASQKSKLSPWLPHCANESSARARLFCLPCAGGSAANFKDWGADFSGDIQVCPIELPGRGTRFNEPLQYDLAGLAESIVDGIWGYLDRPFAVFGHSMGGRLGFEVCRHLQLQRDILPLVFFAAGANSPELPETNPVHHLPDNQLITRLRELNGSRPEVFDYPELLQLILPMLRADLHATETYVYKAGPPLRCPLIALGGISDLETSRHALESWNHYAASFKLRMFPGDHFFIRTAKPQVFQILLEEIHSALLHAEPRQIKQSPDLFYQEISLKRPTLS